MLNKITATVVVAIVVAAGILSVAYVGRALQNHRPIVSNNMVVNETIAENFLNYSIGTSPPTPLYNFNASTSFTWHNFTSDLTLKVINLLPLYEPLGGPSPYVFIFASMLVTGNISPSLRPTDVLVTLSDVGPYNNGNVYESPLDAQSYPPQSNVTAPHTPTMPRAGNFSVRGLFKLINQSATNGLFSFGLLMVVEVFFYIHNHTIGPHVFHLIASLQGLGVPITTTINVLMIDKT